MALLVVVCIPPDASAVGADDAMADVRKAEADFHAACDNWEPVAAADDGTPVVLHEIDVTYRKLLSACSTAKLRFNNAVLVPHQFAWAGKITFPNMKESSCMIGKGQSGLIVSVWHRTPWKDRLPPHGIDGSIGIRPRELQDAFSVAPGTWTDAERTVLRVPYAIGEIKGTIEVRRDGDKWTIQPDRGKLDGVWWEPFSK